MRARLIAVRLIAVRLIAVRLIAVLPLFALLLLAACHTVEGAGEDLSAAGHAITNSAEKVTQ